MSTDKSVDEGYDPAGLEVVDLAHSAVNADELDPGIEADANQYLGTLALDDIEDERFDDGAD